MISLIFFMCCPILFIHDQQAILKMIGLWLQNWSRPGTVPVKISNSKLDKTHVGDNPANFMCQP